MTTYTKGFVPPKPEGFMENFIQLILNALGVFLLFTLFRFLISKGVNYWPTVESAFQALFQ